MPMTIDLGAALAGLNRLASPNMEPWLAAIGKQQQEAIQKRIRETKGSPDYKSWAPWSPRRARERALSGNEPQGLLWDTGHLLHSINFLASPLDVVIGTDVPYAPELQQGRDTPTHMPERPFVGWTDDELGGSLGLEGGLTLDASLLAYMEGLLL